MEIQENEITIIGEKEPLRATTMVIPPDLRESRQETASDDSTLGPAAEPVVSRVSLDPVTEEQEGTGEPEAAQVGAAPEVQQGTAQEDYLLNQIDEFRVKAQQLQELLRVKEDKAKELQQIVNERADKAEELQQIVTERQEKADGITAEVAKQIDEMADKVAAKVEVGLERVNVRLDGMNRALVDQVELKLTSINQTMNQRLDQIGESVSDLNSVNASIASFSEKQELTDSKIEEAGKQIYDISNQLQELHQTSDKLDTMKMELADKIHTESVQSYRNTQELIRGVDEKLNKLDMIDRGVHSVKNMSAAIVVLTVIDLLGVAAAVVLSLGVF